MKLFTRVACASLLMGALNATAECPAGTTQLDKMLDGKTTCALKKVYTDDLFLSNENTYTLQGGVFIGSDDGKGNLDPAVLTIQAGTKILSLNPKKDLSLPEGERVDRKDFLVISRGSKIIAEGTADAPIIFGSAQGMHLSEGERMDYPRKRGDWGGLFLNGYAPVNKCADLNNCNAAGEADTGFYGGNDEFDDSGILTYVRVEFGGDEINDDKQYNGITFNGVGSGTIVEFIQVHKNNDDGIEFFGGNANVKYALITGAGDDSIDWTFGYRGFLQFVAVVQDADDADRGIEADNDSKNADLEPRSNPTLSNITLVGSAAGSNGMKLRAGTGAVITNTVTVGFGKCTDSKDANAASLSLFNNVFACPDMEDAKGFQNNMYVTEGELMLSGLMPQEGSVLLGSGLVPEDFDFFFEPVDYIGAMGDEDWTAGWTTNAQQ